MYEDYSNNKLVIIQPIINIFITYINTIILLLVLQNNILI